MEKASFLLFFMLYLAMGYDMEAYGKTNIFRDKSALLSIKSDFHVHNPKNILETSWSNTSSICKWIGVTCGARHRRVTGLNLSNMNLTGTVPIHLGNLSFLVTLDFSNNYFHGTLPVEISRLRRLKQISFGGNNLTGEISSWLGSLSKLQYLFLNDNQFSGSIPISIANLSLLQGISLSNNQLSGTVPPEIGNLTRLKDLWLGYNKFIGSIPSSIGGLQDMVNLSLANNNLQGSIPVSLGNLLSIELLDLSNNTLSGEIPKSLETLLYLKNLNVSFNKLYGEIPNGGSFTNFSYQSFLPNDALCGAARFRVPPCKNPSRKSHASIRRYLLPSILVTIIIVAFIIFLVILRRRRNSRHEPNTVSLSQATRRRVSYFELLRATDGFNEGNLIGIGSFGSVYKGTLSDGTNVAVKVFNLQLEIALNSFDAECEVLRNIRHRNLVKVITSCSNPDFKALVLEYMPLGSLEKWLYSDELCLNILQRLNIMLDVASTLEYLHHGCSTPIVHCDLKPSNVLLDEDLVAHVSDFGIARLISGGDSVTHTMTLATIGYMAPEYGLQGTVSRRGDVYSYGITLMETFTGKKPTDGMFSGEMDLKHWIENSFPNAITEVIDSKLLRTEAEHYELKKECLSSITELALTCSATSPEERTNMKNVVASLNKVKMKFLKSVAVN